MFSLRLVSRVRPLFSLVRLYVVHLMTLRPPSRIDEGIFYNMVGVRRLSNNDEGTTIRLNNSVSHVKDFPRRVGNAQNVVSTQRRHVTLKSTLPSNKNVHRRLATNHRHLLFTYNRTNILSLLCLVARRVSLSLFFALVNSSNVRLLFSLSGLPMGDVVLLVCHPILNMNVRSALVTNQIRRTCKVILTISISRPATRFPRGNYYNERSVSTTNTLTLNDSLATRNRHF